MSGGVRPAGSLGLAVVGSTEKIDRIPQRFQRTRAFLQRVASGSEGRIKASAARMLAHSMAAITMMIVGLPLYAAVLFGVPDSARWKPAAGSVALWVGIASAVVAWVLTYRDIRARMKADEEKRQSREEA